MQYLLKKTQQLECTIDEAWSFFSSPNNLSLITPVNMKFRVLSDLQQSSIYEGMIIDYTISPILGIPFFWRTKIRETMPGHSFTDIQVQGPYKSWIHRHEFIANKDGVLMIDTILYELPFGILGTLAHKLFVKNKLKDIFDYRRIAIQKIVHSKFKIA